MKIIEADIRNWKAYVTYVVNPESVGDMEPSGRGIGLTLT